LLVANRDGDQPVLWLDSSALGKRSEPGWGYQQQGRQTAPGRTHQRQHQTPISRDALTTVVQRVTPGPRRSGDVKSVFNKKAGFGLQQLTPAPDGLRQWKENPD